MIWKNKKVCIKSCWEHGGRTGLALDEPIWIEQDWLPVLWDDQEDPTFHKLAGIGIHEEER